MNSFVSLDAGTSKKSKVATAAAINIENKLLKNKDMPAIPKEAAQTKQRKRSAVAPTAPAIPKEAAAPQALDSWSEINNILGRQHIVDEIKSILGSFKEKREDNMFKKGIYIYGHPGSGKTQFVLNILREMNYDVVKYDTGDVRNKALIETITRHNMSDRNVLSMMRGEHGRSIAILMDEIDGMNNGDKGGITALIKLIRQKKTKKQKTEEITLNPILCIGNYHTDKKIRELMKVCNTFELKKPTTEQIEQLILWGFLRDSGAPAMHVKKIAHYSQGDLRKLNMFMKIYRETPAAMMANDAFFQMKMYNENTKKITENLINKHHSIDDHGVLMNETDRTIVALLWHENIVDAIDKKPTGTKFRFYQDVLDRICFSDYIDRITFQNQIWQFNEMTSLMKTFHNNKIYHDRFPENAGAFSAAAAAAGAENESHVRFTKVLTKYSTEYNNILFVYNLCQQLDMDQKDVLAFFQALRYQYGDQKVDSEMVARVERLFEKYDINKLYIKRIYRYLDKNVKLDSAEDDEDILEDDDLESDD